jgi:hypothetical protein
MSTRNQISYIAMVHISCAHVPRCTRSSQLAVALAIANVCWDIQSINKGEGRGGERQGGKQSVAFSLARAVRVHVLDYGQGSRKAKLRAG